MFGPRLDITRLEPDVQYYEAQEIETGKIMLYGPSNFTRWTDRALCSPKLYAAAKPSEQEITMKDGTSAIVNHGIGGATAEELLYYYPRLVKPWKPRAMVLHTISNDLSFGYYPAEVMYLLSRILEYARRDFPGIRLYLLDMHPWKINQLNGQTTWASMTREFNQLLKDYCAHHADCTLIEHCTSPVWYRNPDDVGDFDKVRDDIFIDDNIHFNEIGFSLYGQFFREALADLL